MGDDKGPEIYCPVQDVDWDGDYDAFVYSVDPFSCTASITAPAPKVEDDCDYDYTVEIYTVVPELWHGVPTGEYEIVKFHGATINGSSVSGLPKGKHFFNYIVTDECGNTSELYDDAV